MKISGELDYRIRYDVEHDLFHAQNVFDDEYITPTFIEYVQNLEKELTNAKEIIREYINLDYIQLSPCDKVIDLRDKAEQFLNDLEK